MCPKPSTVPDKTKKSLVSLLQNAKKNQLLGKDADSITQPAQSGKAILKSTVTAWIDRATATPSA